MEYWSRDDVVADLDVIEHRRSFAGPTVYRVILKVINPSSYRIFCYRQSYYGDLSTFRIQYYLYI